MSPLPATHEAPSARSPRDNPTRRQGPSFPHTRTPPRPYSLPPVPGSSHGAPHTHSRPPHRQPPSHTPGPRPGASLSHKPTVKPHSCRPHPPPPRSPHTEAPPHPGPQEAVAAGPTPRGQGRGRQGRAGQAGSRRGPALLTFRELQLQLGQLFADLAGQRGDSRGRRFGHGGWKEIRKEKANPAAGSARLRLSAGGSESRAQRERPPPPPC